MARIYRSAINAALDNLNKGSKVAKEVIEGTGKSANRAKMIKNTVNSLQSNMGGTTTKVLNEVGTSTANEVRREGINAAVNQVTARTAQKAMDNATSGGNSAVQKALDVVNHRRIDKVIDGHNAQSRQTAIDTIVNNVKDRNINRVSQGHETARQAVDNANRTVRNARTRGPEVDYTGTPNNTWQNNTRKTMPIVNNYEAPNTGPQASPFIRNQEINTKTNGNTGGSSNTQQRYYKTESEGSGSSSGNKNTTRGPEESSNNSNKNTTNRARKRINENFEGFGEGVKDTFLGGIMDSYGNVRHKKQGLFEAIGNAHKNADGSVNWRRAAGTFVTVSAAARVASGGGLYKDRYGNPNLIGVPFI